MPREDDIALPPGLSRVAALDPALAESLGDDFRRLARVGAALAWADARLPVLLQAPGERALLAALVDEARALTEAPRVFALTWQGDAGGDRASLRALAGDGAAVPEPGAISRTIVGRVARERRPAWSDDAAADARFQAAESVQLASLRSVGCVPVGRHGVLYLLDPEHPGRFPVGARLKLAALCALAGRVLDARERPAAPPPTAPPGLPGLVGTSAAMQELFAAVGAFAPMPWPVLVLGGTGTGKEAVSRAIHALSPRADQPFEAVNCGALVPSLAESTLFGHERGAFTGADRRREGVLARVGAGTLFLDEVGELPAEVQVKLLRVLQEGVFQRVGGDRPQRFAGRVVAATLRPLDDPAARGDFREDLYHRLAACVVRVPPLDARRGDVPALADHLLARARADLPGAPAVDLGAQTVAVLAGRAWPGNVRELENVLRAALARCLARGGDLVEVADLAAPGAGRAAAVPDPAAAPTAGGDAAPPVSRAGGLLAATTAFQRRCLHDALARSGGNRTAAARELGVSRQWLHRLLAREAATEPATEDDGAERG